MSNKETILTVINELIEASKLYYSESKESFLTDEEFDAKQNFLRQSQEEYPELFEEGTKGYEILEGDVLLGAELEMKTTITHTIPMLSLQKASKEKDLMKFLTKLDNEGARDYRLQAKLDGSASSIKYVDGKLTTISSRGDGINGELRNYLINAENLIIKGLPKTVVERQNFEVRGEFYLTTEQFDKVSANRKKVDGTDFENPRNAVSGLLKRAEKGLHYPVEMTFTVCSLYIQEKLTNLNNLPKGFNNIDEVTKELTPDVKLTEFQNINEVYESIQEFGKYIDGFVVPTDGVVIKPVNEAEMDRKMGSNSHHPSSQIAWKYPAEQAESIVQDITITVGRTGRLTPVAWIQPVRLEGSTVAKASLHNFNYVANKNIRVGSKVIVEKANMIIPQVVAVIENPATTTDFEVPTVCPICKTTLLAKGEEVPPKTLLCNNQECPSKDLSALITAVERTRLDIDGLSEAILTRLNDAGKVSNLADLYALTFEDLSELVMGETVKGNQRLLGETVARKILDEIEKSKNASLTNILSSLNIPHLGRRSSKLIVSLYKDLETIQNLSVDELASNEGFGYIKAEAIIEGLKNKKPVIEKMKNLGVKFGNDEENTKDSVSIDLSGLSFSISGSVPEPFENRNALVDYIEANNGKFDSAPKKTTSYMIGDSSDSSSKIKKALANGVEIISPEEFTQKFTH